LCAKDFKLLNKKYGNEISNESKIFCIKLEKVNNQNKNKTQAYVGVGHKNTEYLELGKTMCIGCEMGHIFLLSKLENLKKEIEAEKENKISSKKRKLEEMELESSKKENFQLKKKK